ncbi:MAG: iron-containing alcohol dehydrogenase [candidate division WOR-3 bacterium]
MGGFLDGFEVGSKEIVTDGVKFYKIVDVGFGILEEWAYRLRDIFGKNSCLILHGKSFSRQYGEILKGILGNAGDVLRCIISVGGGSVIDRGKFLSKELGLPFISIPTLLSSDGIASPVGVKNHKSEFIGLPYGVIVDISIISEAPEWSILAGTGDLISNLSASIDWDKFKDKSSEPYSFLASLISKSSALSILDLNPFENLEILAWGLILSGWAMEISGSSRPASGPEHKMSHSLDILGFGGKHGIQVGFFTPLFLKLNGYKDWERVRKYLIGIGFPESIEMKEDFVKMVFSKASFTRPHRWTVLEELGWEKVLNEAVDMGLIKIA